MIKFYEYRDKAGVGSEVNFKTKKEAIAYAKSEWDCLCEYDKKSYLNDTSMFAVINVLGAYVEKDYEIVPTENGDLNEDGSMADFEVVWEPSK